MHFIHPLHYIASKITISGYIPFTLPQAFIYRNIKIHEIIPSSAMPKFLSGGYILIAVTIKKQRSLCPVMMIFLQVLGCGWLHRPPPAACH